MTRAQHPAQRPRRCGSRALAAGLATLAVLAVGLAADGVSDARAASVPPIGAHSMLQLNSPYAFMDSMFEQAAAMHAASIRLDVAPALIFTDPGGPPDFSGLDEVMALSQRYALPVVADLFTVPPWLADCAAPSAGAAVSRCATTDLTGYAAMIGQIVAHAGAVIHDWEVWNEPDNSQFFTGTPQQYAWMLRTAHDAILAADPEAVVLLGGMSSTAAMPWLAAVLATPGADAVHAFAVATVHERGWLTALAADVTAWTRFLAAYGFTGPLWVTEHGYPSDPGYQYDPAYTGGAASQAAFLTASIPTLLDAGAAEVFVAERDNLSGQFASEGVLGGAVSDLDAAAAVITAKPSFTAVQMIADCYAAQGRDCPSAPPSSSPAALDLPATHLGTSTKRTVTVSDPGPAPLVLGTAALIPGTGGGLSIAGNACSSQILEPDERCSMAVRFTPAAGGATTATVALPSDNGTLTVPITAVAPSVSSLVSPPAALRVFVAGGAGDGVGAPQRLTLALANPLAAPVRVAGWALSGPDRRRFTIGSDRCTRSTLAPRAGCRLIVIFTPDRVGAAAAVLTLRGDGSPLLVALDAVAFAAPSVKRVIAGGGLACVRRSGVRRVEALIDEPATLSWQVRRIGDVTGSRCATRAGLAAPPPRRTGSGGRRSAPAGRRWAAGHAPTARRPLAARGIGAHRYAARFGLPLSSGRHGLAPGRYRLTLRAENAHGAGPPDRRTITVLP